MKYFISMPMNGVPDDIINTVMREVRDYISQRTGGEWINNIISSDLQHPLEYLGESIRRMAQADAVFFVSIDSRELQYRWIDRRGCNVEFVAAKEYGIDCFYLRAIEKPNNSYEIVQETGNVRAHHERISWDM
ncbi:hypothetical protein IJJ08_03775 [bacterium]|nr:hypothetical protein [bacterium]